jgi:hypothetical protein
MGGSLLPAIDIAPARKLSRKAPPGMSPTPKAEVLTSGGVSRSVLKY